MGMSKIKTATLTKVERWIGTGLAIRWLVLQVTDSMEFSPGDLLEQPQVARITNDAGWKVKFVKPDLR